MGRRRRRRGPGSGRHASRGGGSRRRVFITPVAPTGDVSSVSPTIRAVVEDRDGNLISRHDIDLYLDGQDKRFTYRRASSREASSREASSSRTPRRQPSRRPRSWAWTSPRCRAPGLTGASPSGTCSRPRTSNRGPWRTAGGKEQRWTTRPKVRPRKPTVP